MSSPSADASRPPPETEPLPRREGWQLAREVMLWRRRGLSLFVLGVSTAMYVVLHPRGLGFTFVTAASWVAICALVSFFIWANLAPLLGKDAPDLSGWKISEKAALETAVTVRGCLEGTARWVFEVAIHREWWALLKMVALLETFALLGSRLDLLTLLYLGVLASLTLSPLYVKYEDKIKSCAERFKGMLRRWVDTLDEKVVKRLTKKVTAKEKKTE